MDLVPLHRSDIQLGREAPFDIYDPHGNKLLSKGVLIASEAVWERLLERGRRDSSDEGASGSRNAEREVPPPPTVFDKVEAFSGELGALHDSLVGGRASGAAAAFHALSDRVVACFDADQDAMLAAFQIGCGDDTPATRMLHVCVLSELMSARLELEQAARRLVRVAALSYDLGMHALYGQLALQAFGLSREQQAQLHGHPQLSVELLRRAGIEDAGWLELVLSHHERIDGSGYPRGLHDSDITRPARILAIADIYSAMIRPRAYRGAINAREAMREIFLERGRWVDPDLSAILIKAVGMYPPGSFVRLASGEVAVVVGRTDNASLPEIRSVVGMEGMPRAVPVARDPQDPLYAIVATVPPSEYRFPMAPVRKLWR
ncbi:hypothetical protein B1992_09720 [Pseudoxanthomonas broegbernensis]|uniref:HD-GYP domain-containing protein n=1 Tax=Pseudoxanthomonas broegbernensis TaxID=83619 RepID=A0A7V8GLN1_9GAMM|nr:HD domain-containing phosphohydrolase [Pseudoxanthomonas broegbernensis]KAF1685974.1 hypothetical protein B1992_09720 [Pseudoxanthomonas broegbernensis]MBB6063772.1 hypothetical protein [Pseudoxanthomonas broegbernensis]